MSKVTITVTREGRYWVASGNGSVWKVSIGFYGPAAAAQRLVESMKLSGALELAGQAGDTYTYSVAAIPPDGSATPSPQASA